MTHSQVIKLSLENANAALNHWTAPFGCELAVCAFGEPFDPVSTSRPGEKRRLERVAGTTAARAASDKLCSRLNSRASTSISHTPIRGQSFALAIAVPDSVARVGIDWEDITRPIDDSVLEKITTLDERSLDLGNLEFCVIKEACFKADAQNHQRAVWEYTITEFNGSEGRAEINRRDQARGHFRFMLIRNGYFCLAAALPADSPLLSTSLPALEETRRVG